MTHPDGNDHGYMLQQGLGVQAFMHAMEEADADEGAVHTPDKSQRPRPGTLPGTLPAKKLDDAPAVSLNSEAAPPLEQAKRSPEKTPSIVNVASPALTTSSVTSAKKGIVATPGGDGEALHMKAAAINVPLSAAAKAGSPAVTKALDGHLTGEKLMDNHAAQSVASQSLHFSGTRDRPARSPHKPSSGYAVPSQSHQFSTPTTSEDTPTSAVGTTLVSLYAMKGLQKYVFGSTLVLIALALGIRYTKDQSLVKKLATNSFTNASLSVDYGAWEPSAKDNSSVDATQPLSFLASLGVDNHPIGKCASSELGSAVVAMKWGVEPCKQHMALNVATFDSDGKGESSAVVMRLQSVESWDKRHVDDIEGVELQNSAGVPLASLSIVRALGPERTPIEPENRRVSVCFAGEIPSSQQFMTFSLKSGGSEGQGSSIAAEGKSSNADRRLDLAVADLVGCEGVAGRHVVVAHRGNVDGDISSQPLLQVLLDEEGQPTTVFHGNGIDVLAEFGVAGPPFPNGWRALRVTTTSKDLPLMVAAVVAARKLAW